MTLRMKIALAAVVTAVALAAVLGGTARADGPGTPPPPTPCGAFGFVVWMIYGNAGGTPVGNTCWTIIKPVTTDKPTYTTCDVSNPTNGQLIGTGGNWIYDDTNTNGHNYTGGSHGSHLTDAQADADYCSSRTSWWGEFMASSGGFHWAWTTTHLFEENYNSSDAYVAYTTSITSEGLGGSGSAFSTVPTIDARDPSAVSHIESNCYKSPWTPTGNYYFAIYVPAAGISSGTLTNIENALMFCYS